jgi:hypothetical protein
MIPMIGARKTEKDDNTVIKVVARLISCQGCTIHAATNVMIAPRRMSTCMLATVMLSIVPGGIRTDIPRKESS